MTVAPRNDPRRSSVQLRSHGLPWPLTPTSTTSAAAQSVSVNVERLRNGHPLLDAVIEEIDGRRIRIGRHWLTDFASCNYLGFDLDPEILDAVDTAIRRWGTHPSWSRLLGSPALYEQIETELTALLGAPDTLLMPTITHIHNSVIPLLAGHGSVFLDARAHKTIYDGCAIARGEGAQLRRFAAGDADHLAKQLKAAAAGQPRLICMDGVDSMTGNIPELGAFARLARDNDALLYVDDAHGFGVIGERSAAEQSPYGARGNSVIRHLGEGYDNVILVAGFSKAYSSLLAFLAIPTDLKNYCKVAAAPYLYSGPSPTASLATVLAGFRVNASRGEQIRADVHRKTGRVLTAVRLLELDTLNRSELPIIEIPIGRADDIDDVGRYLYRRGIYVTLATYPLVPRSDVGIRIQLTAANTDEEIDLLIDVLRDLTALFPMRHPASGEARPTPAVTTPNQAWTAIGVPGPGNVAASNAWVPGSRSPVGESRDTAAMAYDEELANRVREVVRGERGLTEKRMFGGLAFLVDGNMAVSASSKGGLLLRTDPTEAEDLISAPHVGRFEMRGREMDGWLRVDTEAVETDDGLRRWVGRGVTYARSLPSKQRAHASGAAN